MKLMVSLIRQLQLIGIKTNLESFAITILMEHMLTRNQLPLFLWVSKQWGKYTNSVNDRVITYPIAFSELYYANVISSDNCETFVYGISNININYRLCNGYNDDRWNGMQTSRLFAVGR